MSYTTIKLEGCLGEEFIKQFDAFVDSVADAVALCECNFPGFRQRILGLHIEGYAYKVRVGDYEIDESELLYPTGRQTIVIRPVVAASGNIGKIIGGIALVGLGLSGVGLLGFAPATVALVGGAMALSGFAGLFSSPSVQPEEDSKEPSFVMNGAVNTSASGNIVPVVLGRGYQGRGVLVGSQVASAAFRSTLEVFDDD